MITPTHHDELKVNGWLLPAKPVIACESGRSGPYLKEPPAHWGLMLHQWGSQEGTLYHFRKDREFYYDEPAPTRAVESTTTEGRSEIAQFSNPEYTAEVLDTHRREESNLYRRQQASDGQNS